MARITIEDCLKKIPNEYELAILGAMRTQQLLNGARPLVKSGNREVILALREIAAGKVRKSSKELKPLKKKADTQARVKSRDHKSIMPSYFFVLSRRSLAATAFCFCLSIPFCISAISASRCLILRISSCRHRAFVS